MWISVIAWIKNGWSAWLKTIRAYVIYWCAFYRSCPPDPMLSGQGKTLWCTQRGGYGGSNPRWISNLYFNCLCTKNTVQALLPYLWNSKTNVLHENVKICNLFSHFTSVYWLCPWTQLGDFCPADALAPPILDNSWSTSCETLHCEVLGTPIPISIPFKALGCGSPDTLG